MKVEDLELGKKYIDVATGFVGKAKVAACSVGLMGPENNMGTSETRWFDIDRLARVKEEPINYHETPSAGINTSNILATVDAYDPETVGKVSIPADPIAIRFGKLNKKIRVLDRKIDNMFKSFPKFNASGCYCKVNEKGEGDPGAGI